MELPPRQPIRLNLWFFGGAIIVCLMLGVFAALINAEEVLHLIGVAVGFFGGAMYRILKRD